MTSTPERIHVDHSVISRLGHWTTATVFEVRSRKGKAVLDLRSPQITGDIELDLELQRTALVLLLPDDAAVDQWDLRFDGKGRVRDDQQPAEATRRIRLHGAAADSHIRVRRGGSAQLTAMFSRDYLADLRTAHRAGTYPTVDNPARTRA
jgi:hypothetical protein